MNKVIKLLCTFTVFLITPPILAGENLNHLIKEQQDNDTATRYENRVKKKDIYSSVSANGVISFQLPEEKKCFKINQFIIEDSFVESKELEEIQAALQGVCIGEQGINKLAVALQDYFINAGYVTTRITIPGQDLSSKILILKVVAGRIEHILIKNDEVKRWILPFSEGDILNLRTIEQGLENLQKTPGTDVKINIEPGNKDGYSNIVLYPHRKTNWNARASFTNWGDRSTGQYLIGGVGYLYNPAHISDIFYLSGSISSAQSYYNISSYYSFPVGYWDYEFFFSSSRSSQRIDIADTPLDYRGKNNYLNVKASRTLYRDSNKKITGSAEIIRRKAGYKLDDIELELQERNMSNIRLGLNFKKTLLMPYWIAHFIINSFSSGWEGRKRQI